MNGAAAGFVPGGGAGGRRGRVNKRFKRLQKWLTERPKVSSTSRCLLKNSSVGKRAVIKGPKEFRDIREDLHKPKKR